MKCFLLVEIFNVTFVYIENEKFIVLFYMCYFGDTLH